MRVCWWLCLYFYLEHVMTHLLKGACFVATHTHTYTQEHIHQFTHTYVCIHDILTYICKCMGALIWHHCVVRKPKSCATNQIVQLVYSERVRSRKTQPLNIQRTLMTMVNKRELASVDKQLSVCSTNAHISVCVGRAACNKY